MASSGFSFHISFIFNDIFAIDEEFNMADISSITFTRMLGKMQLIGAMKNFHLILVLVFIIFTAISCKKNDNHSSCNDLKLGSLKFSTSELDIMPYHAGNKLVFKSNDFDSIVYNFEEEYFNTLLYTELSPFTSECKGKYYEHEYKFIKFKNRFMDILVVQIYFSNPLMDTLIKKRISIQVKTENVNDGSFHGTYCFQPDTIYNYPDTLLLQLGYVKEFHDSLELGPYTFHNVYELKGIDQFQVLTKFITNLFYTINEGVVGYSLNTGKTYYLSSF